MSENWLDTLNKKIKSTYAILVGKNLAGICVITYYDINAIVLTFSHEMLLLIECVGRESDYSLSFTCSHKEIDKALDIYDAVETKQKSGYVWLTFGVQHEIIKNHLLFKQHKKSKGK